MPLIEELLAKQRQSKQLPIGEIMRAIGYGMGGRAEEYKPLEDKQGDDLESYITKELIKRQFEEQDPIAQLLKKAKVAEAAQTMGDRNLFNQITGKSNEISLPTSPTIPVTSQGTTTETGINLPKTPFETSPQEEDFTQYVGEIDPFTGKTTARAEKGKAQLETSQKLSQKVGEEKIKQVGEATKRISSTRRFTQQFERSFNELEKAFPNIGKVGVEGKWSRLLASGGTKLDYLPQTKAFLVELEPMANQMARDVEGGRITDQDRAIYAKSFANAIINPSETNIRLVSNSLVGLKDKGGDISKVVNELYFSKTPILKKMAEQVFEQYPELRTMGGVTKGGIRYTKE